MNIVELANQRNQEIKDFQGNTYVFSGNLDEILLSKDQLKVLRSKMDIEKILQDIGWIPGVTIKFASQTHKDSIPRIKWNLQGISKPDMGNIATYNSLLPLHHLVFPANADILQRL